MQAKFGWVFRMLEEYPDSRDFGAEAAAAGQPLAEASRKASEVRAWLQKLPLGRRPLVKVQCSRRGTLCFQCSPHLMSLLLALIPLLPIPCACFTDNHIVRLEQGMKGRQKAWSAAMSFDLSTIGS